MVLANAVEVAIWGIQKVVSLLQAATELCGIRVV